jgi:hypothetical protein
LFTTSGSDLRLSHDHAGVGCGEIVMNVDRLINILAAITLIEMMVTIALGA